MDSNCKCKHEFGCHSCTESLRAFIEVGEQALAKYKMAHIQLAMDELKQAVGLARVIAYCSEDKREV